MRNAKREAQESRRQERIGEFLEALEEGVGAKGLEGGAVTEVRMLLNKRDAGDTLFVVKASGAAGQFIAFVGARNVGEAVLTWRQKDTGNGLKWREDVPWGERG